MAKLESRNDIRKKIKDRKDNIKDRGKKMQRVVEDKEQIAKTVKELKLTTTKDGVMAMKKEIGKAADKTKAKFEEHNGKLEQKFTECKHSKDELKRKTKASEKNLGKIEKTKRQIKEATSAKRDLEGARKAAESDKTFTKGEKKHQEAFKSKSESRRDRQRNKLNSIQLHWKSYG